MSTIDPSQLTAADLSNPALTAQDLADITAARPDLRPYVATHPSLYPALGQWLADQGVVLVTYLIMQPWTAVAFRLPWYTPYLPMHLPYYSGIDSLRSVAMWVLSLTCIVTAILLAIPDRKRVVPADRY